MEKVYNKRNITLQIDPSVCVTSRFLCKVTSRLYTGNLKWYKPMDQHANIIFRLYLIILSNILRHG